MPRLQPVPAFSPSAKPAVEIITPAHGSRLSSPLAVVGVRYAGAVSGLAALRIGEVEHLIELDAPSGELRENITLLEGENVIEAAVDGACHRVTVEVTPSSGVSIEQPGARWAHRATSFTGSYAGMSCPAGVISVNGFLQQFAIAGQDGRFAEKVVLRPGPNHLAVQIGDAYATRRVHTSFAPAKLLVTLLWDTPGTDLDLYVIEPSGEAVWYRNKSAPGGGQLDVDCRDGFGPENYSLAGAGGQAPPGSYPVRVHYFADRGVGRTEWTVRLIADEGTRLQQRRMYYGILTAASQQNLRPDASGPDWGDVCTVSIADDGRLTIGPPAPTYYGARITSKRVTFIVDISGSMGAAVSSDKGDSLGSRLEVCKGELRGVIQALTADTRLNIIAFESSYRSCARKLFAATAKGKQRAQRFVDQLRPTGGTNILAPLLAALDDREVDTIYLLSDGEDGREAAILERAAVHNRQRRVTLHTISIGQESAFLRRLAREHSGQYLVR